MRTTPAFGTGSQLLIGTILLIVPITATGLVQSGDRENAIRGVLQDQVRAWNKGDLRGFMQGYWNSPDLSFFSGGKETHGWQATLDRYQKKYQGEGKEMGKLAFRELRIDVTGDDHAFVRGRWELTLTTGKVGGLFTLIFKKMPDGWRIIHDHTSAE